MKFVKTMTSSKRPMRIYDIEPGTLFIRKGAVYIKTIPLDIEKNAICMSTGKPHYIDNSTDIEVFKEDFTITYTNDDLIEFTAKPYKN